MSLFSNSNLYISIFPAVLVVSRENHQEWLCVNSMEFSNKGGDFIVNARNRGHTLIFEPCNVAGSKCEKDYAVVLAYPPLTGP